MSPKKEHSRRQKRLTNRLQALRERTRLLEQELYNYTSEHFRVCMFGSARIKPHDQVYETTKDIARLLGQNGIDVLTGGGPGLMEAANIGVKEGRLVAGTKSKSFGITIELNFFEPHSDHLDIKHHHKKFSSRLDDFMRLSNAVIVVRGGIGTLLELYFSWQLLQVGHLPDRPIILVDRKFWSGLIDWMNQNQVASGLVSDSEFRWLSIVDTPEEVLEVIKGEHEKFLAKKNKAA